MSGKHARLSASSAKRWLVCTGSVNASAGLNKNSQPAAQGTFAHSIAAKCLADQSISPSDFLCKREKVDGFDIECDLEMIEGIRVYLDAIDDDMKQGDLGWIEMALIDELRKIDPDLGGTADYVRYRPSTRSLRVFDFKYGAGVYVDANDNEQMKVYALGALLVVLRQGCTVHEVEMTIVQPRYEGADPVRSWKFKAIELLDFTADLEEAAERTRLPNAPLVAGDHCKFCPAARTCPELEKRQHALIAAEFSAVVPYDPKALAAALAAVPLVKERIKAIEEFAYAEATAGRFGQEHGFKLVDKVARRQWKSEGDVALWAEAHGVDPYAPREVLSPNQIEEKLKAAAPRGKKKAAGAVLEQFVVRVSSGTALVPVADARPPAQRIETGDFPALVSR